MTSANRPILLVEDSLEDADITMRAFKKVGVSNPVYHCLGGDEALDFLHRRGKYTNGEHSPRPCVIVLDLNLPGTDGRELLAEIKGSAQLRSIPVVVMTTSVDERDVQNCYEVGANSYVKKPVDSNGFVRSIQYLKDFWFDVAVLP